MTILIKRWGKKKKKGNNKRKIDGIEEISIKVYSLNTNWIVPFKKCYKYSPFFKQINLLLSISFVLLSIFLLYIIIWRNYKV